MGHLRAAWAIVSIYVQDCFAYPAVSLIWVIADVQSALVLPVVWRAASGQGQAIGGMLPDQLIAYYIVAMTLSQFVVCHLMWDIAWDIREGAFSGQILRPIDFFQMNIARNFAWRLSKLIVFLPLLLLALIVYGGFPHVPLAFSGWFFMALFMAQFLSYCAAYCMALTALWTTEFMSVLRLYYLPEMFLSGRLVPVSTLPEWAQSLASILPFRYTIAFPTDVLLGRAGAATLWQGFQMQMVWILAFLVLGKLLFSRGTRVYTGFGM